MIHESIEKAENTIEYQKACDNVKQLAKAIKQIKMRYYPNFGKVTEEDREKFDRLNEQMKAITAESGLDRLGKALMADIEARYDGKIPEVDEEKMQMPETRNKVYNETLLACYGAIDSGKQALSVGKLKKAKKCQEQLKNYTEIFEKYEDGQKFIKMVIEYQRGKFAELAETRENAENNNDRYENIFKGYFEKTNSKQREEASQNIVELTKQEKEQTKEEVVLE